MNLHIEHRKNLPLISKLDPFWTKKPTDPVEAKAWKKAKESMIVGILVTYVYNYQQQYPCIQCGSFSYPTFHHRDPSTKKGTVNKVIHHSRSFEAPFRELEKCDLLCRICHDRIHRVPKG